MPRARKRAIAYAALDFALFLVGVCLSYDKEIGFGPLAIAMFGIAVITFIAGYDLEDARLGVGLCVLALYISTLLVLLFNSHLREVIDQSETGRHVVWPLTAFATTVVTVFVGSSVVSRQRDSASHGSSHGEEPPP